MATIIVLIKPRNINDAKTNRRKLDEDRDMYMVSEYLAMKYFLITKSFLSVLTMKETGKYILIK